MDFDKRYQDWWEANKHRFLGNIDHARMYGVMCRTDEELTMYERIEKHCEQFSINRMT